MEKKQAGFATAALVCAVVCSDKTAANKTRRHRSMRTQPRLSETETARSVHPLLLAVWCWIELTYWLLTTSTSLFA